MRRAPRDPIGDGRRKPPSPIELTNPWRAYADSELVVPRLLLGSHSPASVFCLHGFPDRGEPRVHVGVRGVLVGCRVQLAGYVGVEIRELGVPASHRGGPAIARKPEIMFTPIASSPLGSCGRAAAGI